LSLGLFLKRDCWKDQHNQEFSGSGRSLESDR
jgi:hypothetical protein